MDKEKPDINEFGHNSFITWTEDDLLKERLENMEPEFICGSCGHTFDSEPPFHDKPEKCPRELCGSDEIQTMEEHDITMQEIFEEY